MWGEIKRRIPFGVGDEGNADDIKLKKRGKTEREEKTSMHKYLAP